VEFTTKSAERHRKLDRGSDLPEEYMQTHWETGPELAIPHVRRASAFQRGEQQMLRFLFLPISSLAPMAGHTPSPPQAPQDAGPGPGLAN
jgi:hypothetical protein